MRFPYVNDVKDLDQEINVSSVQLTKKDVELNKADAAILNVIQITGSLQMKLFVKNVHRIKYLNQMIQQFVLKSNVIHDK